MKNLISFVLICCSSLLFAQNGLVGDYYNGTNFEEKITTRVDSKIDFGWWNERPAEGVSRSYFSIRWTGWLIAPETGTYLFSAKVDDGIRLWVNDVPLINAWDLNNMGEFSNTITLEAGKSYFIKVEYFNAMLEGEITLLWQTPSMVNSPNFSYENFKTVPANQYSQTKIDPKSPVIAAKPIIKPKPNIPPSSQNPDKNREVPKEKKVIKPVSTFEKIDNNLDTKQVLFIKSVDKMTDNSIERLDKVVVFLKENPKAKIVLNGHTDVIGDAEKNKELSISRAKVVADYLISQGIVHTRITFQGFGSTQPFIQNPQTEEEHALNRRVEFVLK